MLKEEKELIDKIIEQSQPRYTDSVKEAGIYIDLKDLWKILNDYNPDFGIILNEKRYNKKTPSEIRGF